MKKAELVFIPSPGISHLVSTVELAKLFAERDEHLSLSVLIIKFQHDTKVSAFLNSLSTSSSSSASSRIKFIEINPKITSNESAGVLSMEKITESGMHLMYKFIESHKSQVRDFLAGINSTRESAKICGVVVDMFCLSMIDVANEFEVPSYFFSTSGAAMLGLIFYLLIESLGDEDSEIGLSIPTFKNLVPYNVLPSMLLDKDGGGYDAFLDMGKKFRETKGIIVNTFLELESHAIEVLSNDETSPKVYTVGPILQLKSNDDHESPEKEKIMKWLDLQPEDSVVFLCFGSLGRFGKAQVKEIAYALEGSGHRFLWSLRMPPSPSTKVAKTDGASPDEHENYLEEVLPEGFLQRTKKKGAGMVIGWAPQVAVLSHTAVGGFVSHCGWNSILESVWFGVPMAAWPLYAEQQMNAFQLVKDLGLGVEVKMDYRTDFKNPYSEEIVRADVIKEKIKKLMDPENGVRKNMKEMKEKSRVALDQEKGSSSASLKEFINGVVNGLSMI